MNGTWPEPDHAMLSRYESPAARSRPDRGLPAEQQLAIDHASLRSMAHVLGKPADALAGAGHQGDLLSNPRPGSMHPSYVGHWAWIATRNPVT